jgi:hypothetical protein
MREIGIGNKEAGVCPEIVRSQKFGKSTTKINSVFEENESRIERFRKPERSDVGEALLKWFK